MHPFCQIKGNSWPFSLSVCKHPVWFFCLCQVRKGFWKPPPQIWLGDASKVRVLDPHFLHQTAVKLLKINFHPKSKQVSDHFHLSVFCLVFLQSWLCVISICGSRSFSADRNQTVFIPYSNQSHFLLNHKFLLCNCGGDVAIPRISGILCSRLFFLFCALFPMFLFFFSGLSLLPTWMLTRVDGASAD